MVAVREQGSQPKEKKGMVASGRTTSLTAVSGVSLSGSKKRPACCWNRQI